MRNATICLFLLPFTGIASAAEPPNVLFIAVDDLNDWIGCMKGHPQAKTPNMDRLAARGMLFTNAHCAAPACNPSRAAVFSGLMPNKTRIWSNTSGSLAKRYPQAKLLPEVFHKAGYQTLGTGKLLHSRGTSAFDEYHTVGQRWSPFSRKAVEYTDRELPSKGTDNPRHVIRDARGREIILPLNRMPSDRKPKGKAGESFDWGPMDVPDSAMGDTQITNWAIKRLKRGFQKPFFLGVGYYRPHIPLWVPKKYFARFRENPGRLPKVKSDDLDDIGKTARKWALEPITAGSHATVLKHKQWRAAVEAYLACVTYVDHEIGRLIKALDESSYSDNTIVVLWSDHGWHLGEKQHWGKWTGWERSTRVPLIVVPAKKHRGGFAKPGEKCNVPVGLIDLYPTLTEMAGIKTAGALSGRSLVPLLKKPRRKTERVAVTMFDPGNVSVRGQRWRYIRYRDRSEELYDHRNDPHEFHNLAAKPEYAAIKAVLAKHIPKPQ